MFAKYNISTKENSPKHLGVSGLYFHILMGRKVLKIQLEDLNGVTLEKRRKLAPLVIGGIITSLSLLSILLYSSSFEMIGLIGFGLLLTYFGTAEYTVLRLEYASTNELLWMPMSVKIESIRPFIAILEFYISKKQFPVLYASPVEPEDNGVIHYESSPVKSTGNIIYQFGQSLDNSMRQIPVNPVLLDHTIIIEGQGKVIAEGEYLVNQSAVIPINSTNAT